MRQAGWALLGFIASALLSSAGAEEFPTHDIAAACRRVATSEAQFGSCVAKEQAAIDLARMRWQQTSPETQRECRRAEFYVGIIECISARGG